MIDSPTIAIAVMVVVTLVIAWVGTQLARLADRLADRSGLGEAVVGVFLLAGATSLPDFAATLGASIDGRAELALSNVMGSMAANLLFLAIADMAHRKANLEHAAASPENLMQGALLIPLLLLPLLAMHAPGATLFGVHAASALIVLGYGYGMRLMKESRDRPMWRPRYTRLTVRDQPAPDSRDDSLANLWLRFGILALVTGGCGWLLMEAAKAITDAGLVPDSVAGGVFTAVTTSSPELVTTIAAVRAGALTLAVGNIVGTNFFNVLVIAAADVGYRDGSIYAAVSQGQTVWGLAGVLMTSVLLVGLIRRQAFGPGRIGTESSLMILIYLAAVALVLRQ